MDNIDEVVIDLKPPKDAAFNNESISLEHVKQEINISEENINGLSDDKFELDTQAVKLTNEESHQHGKYIQTRVSSNDKLKIRHEEVHLAQEERQMFPCVHCGKKYARKQTLKYHLEDSHADSRSKYASKKFHKCSICGYQSRYMSFVKRHEEVHLAPEERQMFPCVHCGKKYARKQSLEHHLEDNHVDSRSKEARKNMQKCSICGYQTRNMIHFGQHQQIHLAPEERQMFACAYCDKKYTRKYKLKCHLADNHIESSYKTIKPKKINHKKKESKKKFYKCAICDFQTLHSPNLTRHKKVHLPPEERQMFACIQCNTNYRSKMGLQRHLKRGHVDSRNAEFPEKSPTDEVILDSLKIELDDHALLLDDSKNSECLPVSNEVKSEDFLKTEPEYVALSLNRDMHDDFSVSSHADCISVTDKVILDSVKIEIDDPLLDDSKNSDCISVTNEVKSEDFIKTEPEDDALILDRHAR
ncbi:zinc finger protein 320-like isoform X3 [Sitophilus oryzae]|uniref:Zinc finger protein 320-like isoform X3 n=1 Tax=Sitophilus oryzae TaxID=7048 RepID=A0A6J2XNP3_SITOR|nr:zinc finger protein 320-like isoform X3 [Sitophilus oryzae]